MRERYCLRVLRDEQLLSALSSLVKTGNALNADVLAHLAELDERRLYLELGFSSLFAYCVEALGMDESAAGRRITAARVCRRFSGTFSQVASGALGLSVLCALNPYLSQENATELLEACSNKTRRRVDEILAARFPKPDVQDLIRRVPNQAESRSVLATTIIDCTPRTPTPTPTPESAPTATASLTASPTATAMLNARDQLRSPPKPIENPQRRIEPLSADRYGFHFTGNARLKEKFEQARALLSHELPSGEMATLFELALDALLRDREKKRFAIGRKPRRSSRQHSPGKRPLQTTSEGLELAESAESQRPASHQRTRHIPAAVARQVYARDGGRCCFVSKSGKRCNAQAFLEIDHVRPFAAGGPAVPNNLRLRCRAHNQWHAQRYFGRERINAARAMRESTIAQANDCRVSRGTAEG